MNKENCALKLVDEIILYCDTRSKKHQINLSASGKDLKRESTQPAGVKKRLNLTKYLNSFKLSIRVSHIDTCVTYFPIEHSNFLCNTFR